MRVIEFASMGLPPHGICFPADCPAQLRLAVKARTSSREPLANNIQDAMKTSRKSSGIASAKAPRRRDERAPAPTSKRALLETACVASAIGITSIAKSGYAVNASTRRRTAAGHAIVTNAIPRRDACRERCGRTWPQGGPASPVDRADPRRAAAG